MGKTHKALTLALDALEQHYLEDLHSVQGKAIVALREALAEQPAPVAKPHEQEPKYAWPTVADYERDVGFETNQAFRMAWNMARTTNKMLGHTSPPAQQEPVTPCTHPSLGFSSLREDGAASRWSCVMCGTEFVPKATQRWTEFNEATKRNIEHAEWYMSTHSNLAEQAPTAWILKCGEQQELWWEKPPFGEATPLYTSPQRTWVGLTDDEIDGFRDANSEGRGAGWRFNFKGFARAIEAKLRSKNEDRN